MLWYLKDCKAGCVPRFLACAGWAVVPMVLCTCARTRNLESRRKRVLVIFVVLFLFVDCQIVIVLVPGHTWTLVFILSPS